MKFGRSPGLPRGFIIDPKEIGAIVLRPVSFLVGKAAQTALVSGQALPLGGGPLFFSAIEVFLTVGDNICIVNSNVSEVEQWAAAECRHVKEAIAKQLDALSNARPPFAGLTMDRPRLMGVVNLTPDSFYDGGRLLTVEAAVAHGRKLWKAGADLLDIGGESTRPGSKIISVQEELDRVLPVIEALAKEGALISGDTRRVLVMQAAIAAGARIINDVSALTESGATVAVAEAGAAVILMHMQGTPITMQNNPTYDHAPFEILRYFLGRISACEEAGIDRSAIAVDPGIGFGKKTAHNLQIFQQMAMFHASGCPVVVGASRKSFIGAIAGIDHPDFRLPGSIAAATLAASQGVKLHRVHDVDETKQALALVHAIQETG